MTDQDQPVLKRRGGIWGVIGLLLVAGIVAVSVIKYMDEGEGENPPPEQVTPPRHLLVISIDTLRADHLGCYGYGKPTSPSIDALAKEGVLFENHYTCYPLTLPAHLTQLTGVSTLGHRVRDNLYHQLPTEIATLPETMKAEGFRTGAFVSAHTMKAGSGIERGFEVYDDKDVRTLEPGRLTVRERSAPETLKLAGDWIASLGSDRFFCFVHLFDPHAPYLPHADVGDQFQGDNTARYDGEIAYTDREIGRFILRLTELGLLKDTLVVITADHGEGLGQHDELTHGYYCYDTTTRVPLIIKGAPGMKAGTRVPHLAANYDLAPTLLELMGVEAPEFRKQMHGVSLVSAMRDGTDPGRAGIFIESHYAWLNASWAKIRALRTPKALALFAGDEVKYLADAEQLTDSAGDNATALAEARSEINRLMAAWVPPRKGKGMVRETTAGTPYPGESAVAQDFEPESLSDTRERPSPHTKAKTLLAYQSAELEYDSERFAACAEKLRELLKTEPEFVMALKLLAAVNKGMVVTDRQLGVDRARQLTREAADSLKRVADLQSAHGQSEAADDTRRSMALLLVWLNDIAELRKLSAASDEPAIDWMFHLVSYRVAGKPNEPAVTEEAARFLHKAPPGLSFMEDAKRDLQRMQAGEPLKLAPWEQ